MVAAARARLEVDVLRLEVAVEDTERVRLRDGGARLIEHVDGDVERQRALVEERAQRPAAEQLHHQVREPRLAAIREAEVRDVDHVGVAHLPGRSRLALEPLDGRVVRRQLRHEHLERDLAARPEVRRAVHGAHPAAAEQGVDAVLAVHDLADQGLRARHAPRRRAARARRVKPPRHAAAARNKAEIR